MRQQTPRPRRSRAAQILSTILFIAAIGFAAAAAYLWYTEDDDDGPGPPPTATAGSVELSNVLAVVEEDEPEWDYGRLTARSDQLSPPCQPLQLGDTNLCVFIFPGETPEDRIAAREAAASSVDLDSMTISTPSGRVVNNDGQQLHMAQASNVITILVGGDQELAAQIEDALAKLP